MDAKKRPRRNHPADEANFLSIFTFSYMLPLFWRGFKSEIKEEDLCKPLDEDKSSQLGDKLEKIWKEKFVKHKKYALHLALFEEFGAQFVFYGLLRFLDELMLVIVPPYAMGRIISYYQNKYSDVTETEAYIQALVIVVCLVLNALFTHAPYMGLMHLTMKMRISCSALLYRKMLRLNRTSLADTTIGQFVNLLSNDVSKFDQGFFLANYVWITPIHAAVGTYALYRQVGISAFFGVAFILAFIPIQIVLSKRTSVLRLKTALRTDERVRLINEIISGIQVIKMYCWEKPFAKLVAWARKKEMNAIRQRALIQSLFNSFEMFVARTSVFISVIGYVLFESHITADQAFTVKAIFDVLRSVLILHFSISASSVAETNVSIFRIQKVLSYSEQDNKTPKLNSSNPKIRFENADAKWSDEKILSKINFDVSSNQLVAIIGPVGCGKSSLLNAILKELPITRGNLHIEGKISYSAQDAWLFPASVRQNILFNNEYDEKRYQRVVDICALTSDFDLLPYGDRTLVGEKGKSLSGGQKARINLARCLYNEADIYLLDDPLSAVDANVGKHLYEKSMKEFLRDKICVLVTHQLQYLSSADRVVIMKEGRIETEGKYAELQTSGLDFVQLIQDEEEDEDQDVMENEKSDNPEIEKERVEEGSVRLGLYLTYFKAGGGNLMMLLLALAFLISQGVASYSDYYISYWTRWEQDHIQDNHTLNRDPLIYTYSGIILATIVLAIVHPLFFMLYFTLASTNLHNICFSKLTNATMKFYNDNLSGRILNRFSTDIGSIDEYIPPVLFDVVEIGLMLLGSLALSFIIDYWLFIPALFLMLLFYLLRLIYIRTSRSFKRIEGITRSPIFGHMSASVQGLSTIRAFSAQEALIKEFNNYQDDHSAAWYLSIASNRAFGFWVDITCIIFFAIAIFILMYFNKNIYGGDIGLVITHYTTFINSLQWELRQLSELENCMVSVERLLEYKKIESEPVRKSLERIPKGWPQSGEIQFRNVSLKYNANEDYVLKDLNFTVLSQEKIGIVGRTGAGKTSTITALFQLYPIEGRIIIDNVDTTLVPLDHVRSKISIIPQEPVLFSGTIRKNLDPFEEFSDEILWNVLQQVELKAVISELADGLLSKVSEGGSNFSVGQRQLICLARALIRKNKILVMDEATANVDPQTDAIIQKTIRERFVDCTVLTIAHRLHTVMDCDKIMVMEAGLLKEFDHPYVLLQNEESILYSLVQNTGRATASHLENIAKMGYKK